MSVQLGEVVCVGGRGTYKNSLNFALNFYVNLTLLFKKYSLLIF